MNDETKGASIVTEGTPLAQVYPLIQKEKEVKIVTYIPSKDIATIHVGDRIRFSTQGSKQKPITLEAVLAPLLRVPLGQNRGTFSKSREFFVSRIRKPNSYGTDWKGSVS